MSTSLVITQLLLKKAEVEAQIVSLTDRLADAKADLFHVVAAVRLFDPTLVDRPATVYHGVTRAMHRSSLFALCKAALEASPEPLDTRQLARHVITAEGWDSDDHRFADNGAQGRIAVGAFRAPRDRAEGRDAPGRHALADAGRVMLPMSEPQIISTLKAKRLDVEASIKLYEGKLAQARRDLAHLSATLAIFATSDPADIRAYTDTSRLFRRGELWTLCLKFLGEHGPQDTRELSRRVAEAKGMDAADPVLCKAIAYRIVQAMTLQWKRGKLGSDGLRKGVRVWACINT